MKTTPLRRIPGIILALALAVGLAACSAVKLGYNNLADLAYWWIDGYVDLSDPQEEQVRDSLARLHAWHRRDELPKIAEVLGRMEQLAPGPVTPAQACDLLAELQARGFAVADRAEPALLTLATGLQPAQLQHLERKYRTNNQQFRKEWIDVPPAQQKEKRFEQVLERAEMIYGRLDEPQRTVLRQQLEGARFDAQKALAERQRRQQDLLQTLRRVADPALPGTEVRALLRGFLERSVRSPDPALRRYQEEVAQEGCRILAAVHASTTPRQRQQAANRLRAYQRDLRELAAGD